MQTKYAQVSQNHADLQYIQYFICSDGTAQTFEIEKNRPEPKYQVEFYKCDASFSFHPSQNNS